jgi:hypothetical protein
LFSLPPLAQEVEWRICRPSFFSSLLQSWVVSLNWGLDAIFLCFSFRSFLGLDLFDHIVGAGK